MFKIIFHIFFSLAQQPNCSPDRLTVDVSRSHTITYTRQCPSKRVISSSQRPLPTQHTNIHSFSGIRTRDPNNQAAAGLRPPVLAILPTFLHMQCHSSDMFPFPLLRYLFLSRGNLCPVTKYTCTLV